MKTTTIVESFLLSEICILRYGFKTVIFMQKAMYMGRHSTGSRLRLHLFTDCFMKISLQSSEQI